MVAPYTSHGIGGSNRFCAYTAGGSSIHYQTLSSGNNCERGKGNSQNSNYSAPVMLQVYSKAIPGQDSEDKTNQPGRPRWHWDQDTTEGGTRFSSNMDEGHPSNSPTRRENRHQVREVLGLAGQATRTRGAQPPPSQILELEAPGVTHQDSSL